MKSITVMCPAKINLFLNILGKDENYHQMHTVNQSISIYDELTIKVIDDGIKITCNDPSIPTDNKNSVYKAIKLFLEYNKLECGVDIHIEKNIPTMSGLGGESTDAAGTLLGLNEIFDSKMSEEELINLGFKIGCDVPFCIKGGTVETLGYGEILNPYGVTFNNFIIINPNLKFSTKEMFQRYDQLNNFECVPITIGYNDFHKVLDSELLDLIKYLKDNGAIYSNLTGSGSSIIGIYRNYKTRDLAFNLLKNNINKDYRVVCADSVDGVKIKQKIIKY